MKTQRFATWASFKKSVIDRFNLLDPDRRALFWFRGQPDASVPLRTTLDRRGTFASDEERAGFAGALLAEFAKEMIGLTRARKLHGDPLGLLARHHGLPSPLLDWTESPYIAAYFAFEDALGQPPSQNVAVFSVNRGKIPKTVDIEFIQDRELLRYNLRALEQRGAFMRVNTKENLEDLLGDALSRFEVPAQEAATALRDLEAMNITARNLFRDFDGAARTAWIRTQLSNT